MLFKIVVVILLAIIFRHLLYFVDLLGIFCTVRTHWPGPCRNVQPVTTGSEKIVVTKDGLAFITSGLLTVGGGEILDPRMRQTFEGRIYTFDFKSPGKDAIALKIDTEFDLIPHGMSLFEESGEIRLFVVNHRENEDTVEIMTYDRVKQMLHHETTIYDPLFMNLNDVVADSVNSFYATNDGYFRNSSLRIPERLLTLPWGSVVYFDGNTTSMVVEQLFEPNGIALSTEKSLMFVTFPFLKYVHVYDRHRNGSVSLAHELNVKTSFDNVYVQPNTGDLWLGAVAIPHMLAASVANMTNISPAAVCRLEPRGPSTDLFQSFHLYEVFADTTGLLSGSSCVVEFDGNILIGSPFQKLAFCILETKY